MQTSRANPEAAGGDEVREISDLQRRVLAIPEAADVFLGGGRGGAKSYTLALLALRHAEQYGNRARILYLRQSHKGCADFEALCLELFGALYGRDFRYNSHEGVGKFPNGARIEIDQLADPSEYAKFQGRSFSLLLADEIGQWATPDLLDKLRSNLRGPKDMPIRCIAAGNPGDVGHQWVAARYVFKAAPWVPFLEPKSGRMWVHAPSTFLDNPFIDQEQYRRQLQASCPTDPELLRSWLEGDWTVARGSYFASVLEESRNATDNWAEIPALHGKPWETYLAMDFGSAAPAVVFLVARSPGATGPDGRWYARDGLICVDELATNEPGSLSKGMGWTVPVLAEEIQRMSERWQVRAQGLADDAIFARSGSGAGSIAEEFSRAGVYFTPARKADRRSGWETMRRLLQDAGKPDVPGLYFARRCEYTWATLPYLGRDPRRTDDVDSRGNDHAADAARYACLWQPGMTVRPLREVLGV